MTNYYQVGVFTVDEIGSPEDPITDTKKAQDLAGLIGVQIVEAVDEEQGQYLAILSKALEAAFLKGRDLEIRVDIGIGTEGPWALVAEIP